MMSDRYVITQNGARGPMFIEGVASIELDDGAIALSPSWTWRISEAMRFPSWESTVMFMWHNAIAHGHSVFLEE